MTHTERTLEAVARGDARGETAATWQGRTNDETTAPDWLSGEWAGDSVSEILGDLLGDDDDNECLDWEREEILEAYCDAADVAFYREIATRRPGVNLA